MHLRMPLSSKLHASQVPQGDLALNKRGQVQKYRIETGDSTWRYWVQLVLLLYYYKQG